MSTESNSSESTSIRDMSGESLRADCENCFGLCCVALPFAASADFAFDKDGGTPCRNLQSDFRCRIHKDLRHKGLRGCTVYECFGAGQKVSQVTFGGRDWRDDATIAKQMFKVFPVMQQLHEMLWYLTEAMTFHAALAMHGDLSQALDETSRLTGLSPDALLELNVATHRADVNSLLLRVSDLVRAESRLTHKRSNKGKTYGPRADLVGVNLRRADLSGSNLRGAFLIAANLREADMRYCDLIGADFRDADLRGADLTGGGSHWEHLSNTRPN